METMPRPLRRAYFVHVVREIDGTVIDTELVVPGHQMVAVHTEQRLMPGELLVFERTGYVDV